MSVDRTKGWIDTHVHVWTLNPARYPWDPIIPEAPIPDRPATPDTLLEVSKAAGISRLVLVQPSSYGWDNSYMFDVLKRLPGTVAGVALIDPKSPSREHHFDALSRQPAVKGVRFHLLRSDQERVFDSAIPAVIRAAERNGLIITVQSRPHHLGTVKLLARKAANVAVVLDHIGLVSPKDWTAYSDALRQIAAYPNVYIKLSGFEVLSRVGYPFADCWDEVDAVIDAFGPARSMWGSNFPHSVAAASYLDMVTFFADRLQGFSPDEREMITRGTAERLWF